MRADALLPLGVQVLERGWLSSNNVVLTGGDDDAALVDSGYYLHSEQTVALVAQALQGQHLRFLLNTHLHSDHCGGNAALQAAYPSLHTAIAPGQAAAVRDWCPQTLSYTPTGQHCPPFHYEALLEPGQEVRLGHQRWQIHAAPGHDTHAVLLFDPAHRLLISADALWENGFGVVFPELDGQDAFDSVAATLDLIASLQPAVVIPGHGKVFTDVPQAIVRARKRLDYFVQQPARHRNYAGKVLLKFRLLELQQVSIEALLAWACATPYVHSLWQRFHADQPIQTYVLDLLEQLVQAGAVARQGERLLNRD